METDIFRFREFRIDQTNVTWKVGTDGVLLGAWSSVKGRRILDIGAGTGLLALMAAQRNTIANITAVEIDRRTSEVARQNFENSLWKGRLNVMHADVRQVEFDDKYDVILSNPPFFTGDLQPNGQRRLLARFGEGLNIYGVIDISEALLDPSGALNLILPYTQVEDVIMYAVRTGLYAKRRCDVRHSAKHDFTRSLLELGYEKAPCKHEALDLYENDIQSSAYGLLMAPYRDPIFTWGHSKQKSGSAKR